MSLKARLTVAVVVLLTAATAFLGWVVVASTQQYLVQRIDTRLLQPSRPFPHEATNPALPGFVPPQPPGQEPTSGTQAPDGETTGFYVWSAAAGSWHVFSPDGQVQDPAPALPTPGTDAYTALLGHPATLASADGAATYRAVARIGQNGAPTVVATSLADVSSTVAQLLRTVLVAGFGVVVLGALLSWWLISRGLRPVDRMIDTAAAIAGGDLSQRVAYADERTELGRLAKALDEMLAQLEYDAEQREKAQERLRQFVADASHELRTPVAAIRGYSELYEQGGVAPGPALDRAMGRINSESTRMGELIEELLVLARLDRRQPLARTDVDLSAVVRDCAAAFAAIDPARPLAVRVVDDQHVLGDARRLRDVVDNLVGNAFRHTPPGAAVEVELRAAGGDAVVEVRDHGAGIPPADREKVFERFYRGDSSRTRATGGSGLGLSIVQSVVEAHDGTIELTDRVADDPGSGTRFVVRLPLATAGSLTAAPAHAGDDVAGGAGTAGAADDGGVAGAVTPAAVRA